MGDIIKYLGLTPEEWKVMLGEQHFVKYLPYIVDLIIIWSITGDILKPMPSSEYHKVRSELYDAISDYFTTVIQGIKGLKSNHVM